MLSELRSRLVMVYLGLLALTFMSFELVGLPFAQPYTRAIAVLTIGFVKARYIGLEFMGLRRAPMPLRIAFELWGAVTLFLLVVLW